MNRSMNRLWFVSIYGIALLISGCATVHFDALNISVPVMMNAKNAPPPRTVTHFTLRQNVSFLFLHRLIGAGKPDVSAMLENQLRLTPGDAIVNLRIHGDTDVGDFLLPIGVGFAGGIIFPPFYFFLYQPLLFDLKSYTIEGDVVTYGIPPTPVPAVVPKIDPFTGLPLIENKTVEFDPETGLPKK